MNLEEHRRTLTRLRTEALSEQHQLDQRQDTASADEAGNYAETIDEALSQLSAFGKVYA